MAYPMPRQADKSEEAHGELGFWMAKGRANGILEGKTCDEHGREHENV